MDRDEKQTGAGGILPDALALVSEALGRLTNTARNMTRAVRKEKACWAKCMRRPPTCSIC